ncbi:hypothetical protein QQS21_008238 [Conoideocrella luteorostrata]|uniref:Elongation factor 1 alpha-like protein n=1 Tax=Conoideocrella luteorostrata TaxID=1105319 RepID=A0AAJ0CJ73_9HYPO|nr:hypothetical protein QQS21_008238 [Conoideocrella luteorostrata]
MAPADLYDDDDFYDGEDYGDEQGDDLSPEDKAAMEKGTEDVKISLGANAGKVTIKQIQDALWHYFYDVDKSVAYLNKTVIAPPPKATPKKTPESKLNGFSFSPKLGLFVRCTGADTGFSWTSPFQTPDTLPPPSYAFGSGPHSSYLKPDFSDMPWMNTPQRRQATMIAPVHPRGGLLGGVGETPKMSKLQALAAARKKKTDEKKALNKSEHAESGMKRLSIADDTQKENRKAASSPAKRLRGPDEPTLLARSPIRHGGAYQDISEHQEDGVAYNKANVNKEAAKDSTSFPISESQDESASTPILKSSPSAFAKTLFGSTPGNHQANRPAFYALPYASSSSFLTAAFSEPSPDDVVLAAQAKAGKKTAVAPKAANPVAKKALKNDLAPKDADVINGVSNLKFTDMPPPKSKGLDVAKEYESSGYKKSISFVVVGHVDAGKSTLMGRLLLELKYVQERTVDKYRRQAEKSGKQSFALAWVMDQRTEERERGVTIDIATNHFETPNKKFTILDAPGHRDFVPNMIAGASQADFAILVIDANTGAYEKGLKGQTREHVLLLRSLGVQRLVVAVNKLDMVDWSKDRFDEISQQVMGFLTGLGFQSKLVSFIPISGLNGDNIAGKTEAKAAAWYQGPTLMAALEDSEPSAARALTKPFRMPISEVFRSQQQGTTTLAGRIDSGNIQIGDAVLVQPSGESAYIKSVMTDEESREWAVAGQSVNIALTDIDPIHIRVGDILCGVVNPISVGDTFTMKAMAFEHLMPMPVDLHRGRLHAAGHIQSIPATLDKVTGEVMKKKPKVVQPGGVARVLVKLAAKAPLEKGQRVVLRSGGNTIAAGLLE